MPNAVYDDQDTTADDLNPAAAAERERLARATNPTTTDDDTFSKLTSPSHLAKSGTPGALVGGRKNNPDDKGKIAENNVEKQPKTRLGKAVAKGRRKYGKLFKNKWLIGVGIGGSGIVMLMLFLFILLGAFKLPHVTQNIAEWRFARIMSRQAVQNNRTLTTKIAVAAASNTSYNRLKATYFDGKGKVADTWSKLDKYRPGKQIQNLNTNNNLTFNYQGRRLVGITMNDRTLLTPRSNFIKDRIPGYTFTQDTRIAQQFAPELNNALRTNEIGWIVRSRVNSKIRQQLGISFVAWQIGQYKGKTAQEVANAEDRANAKAVNKPDTKAPVSSELEDKVNKAKTALAETIDDDDQLEKARANSGVSPATAAAIDDVGKVDIFRSALGVANPIYAVAAPLCIIYDGSMEQSEGTIDANSQAQMAAWNRFATISDQQKDGTTVDPNIIKAYDDKLGPVAGTIVDNRSNGKPYTTAGAVSPQSSAIGSFTLFNAALPGLDDDALGVANEVTEKVCHVLTDVKVAAGLGIANILASIFTVGTKDAFLQPIQGAARVTVNQITKKAVERFSLRQAVRNLPSNITGGQKMKIFLGKEVSKAGSVVGATLLAKQYVAHKAGLLNSGLETGGDYVSMLDSGANLNANEISRQGQFGRPLTRSEVNDDTVQTENMISSKNADKSTFERYFAISNPQSLITNVGNSMTSSWTNTSLLQKLNPSSITANLSSALTARTTASAVGEANYYNVQWGWPEEEINLMQSDSSYEMLENQSILDASGKQDEIAEKYNKCFGVDGDQTTVGKLLADGDIQRDENANVLNDRGDCSPVNLSFNNPEYGDLVFRWRVAQADEADLDEKIYQQEITTTAPVVDAESEAGIKRFKIATWNAKVGNSTAAWTEAANNIIDKGIDIVGTQELERAPAYTTYRQVIKSRDYAIYPDYDNGTKIARNGLNARSIIYNPKKFELVSDSYFRYPRNDDGGYSNKYEEVKPAQANAPVLQFRSLPDGDDPGGQDIFVINVHSAAGGNRMKQRFETNKILVEQVEKINQSNPGVPIFIVGDFNEGTGVRRIGGGLNNFTLDNNRENLLYCMFGKNELMVNAEDASNGNKTTCNPPKGAGGVDYVYGSPNVTFSNFKKLPKSVSRSDHQPVTVIASIAGSSGESSSGGGWQWPFAKKDFVGPFGSNVWGSCYVRCRHAGVDMGGTGGKTVLAAHDGTVVSVSSSGECKGIVVIKAQGTPYWHAYQHIVGIRPAVGEKVSAGDPIGTVYNGPNTGCIFGPHLHFSIEKSPKVSTYADGLLVCDVNSVDCAKNMTSLPPLCFLDSKGYNLGLSVNNKQLKGSDYCKKVLGG